MPPSLSKHLEKQGIVDFLPQKKKRTSPLWDGPESNTENGGVTFSLLNRFLQCRERFRLYVVDGYRPEATFNHKIEYGNMWHVCEEAHAAPGHAQGKLIEPDRNIGLTYYAQELCKKYPTQQKEINHWYNVCKTQFPLYVEYWASHPDMKNRTPLLQEQVFNVPYQLQSGRTVYLRGKWDSVDVVNFTDIWCMENKTKGDIKLDLIKRQMTFDLQSMLYIVALEKYFEWDTKAKFPANSRIEGIRYNVVRRPLSGGKGTIKPKKGKPAKLLKSGKISKAIPGETSTEFYNRLGKYIKDDPEHYFMRLNVTVTDEDIGRFKRECLDPLLEQLCDWWEYINSIQYLADSLWTGKTSNSPNKIHFRMPFGIRQLEDGMSTDLDNLLETGNDIGLQQVDTLFSELT